MVAAGPRGHATFLNANDAARDAVSGNMSLARLSAGSGQGHSLGITMKNGKLSSPMDLIMPDTPGTGGLAKECWDFTTPLNGNECEGPIGPPA